MVLKIFYGFFLFFSEILTCDVLGAHGPFSGQWSARMIFLKKNKNFSLAETS